MENIVHIANDQDIPRIPATSFMERRKFLNEWMEIKAQLKCGENVVEHRSTLQLDQDIQAFSKEEMDRALLNSTSKPLGSCGLTMKDKSSFNISGSIPQSI
ncbi:hypothetical protein CR513_56765, partial [Mucuna pruriens]